MIKLEHVVLASSEQMEFIIEGMRNPMNSWNKTDSFNGCETYKGISKCLDCDGVRECGAVNKYLIVGENDHSLMQRLAKEFTLEDFSCEHLMNVPGEGVLPPLAVLETTIDTLNAYRKLYLGTLSPDGSIGIPENRKDIWWQMIQLLPSSYNQTRNVMMNYEVLANIYKSRKDHKLDEWRSFCKWIEELPYSELITGKTEED